MSDPNMIMNFANNQPTLLTNIGQNIAGLGGALIQQEVDRKNGVAYKDAQDAWDLDPSKENYRTLMAASRPLGIYDQTVADIEGMDAITQKNRLDRNAKLIAAAESNNGDPKYALQLLEEERDALIADGEEDEAKGIQKSIDRINEGDLSGFSKDLQIVTGILTGGQDFLENYRAANKDERDYEAHIVDMIKDGTSIDYNSVSGKVWAKSLASNFSNPELAETIIDLGQVIGTEGGEISNEAVSAYMNIKKDYNDETRPYKETVYNTQVLHDLGNADSGMADNAMITMINLVVDSKTGVREAEAARAARSVGTWEEIKNMYAKFVDGVLPPEGREQLLEAARLIHEHARSKLGALRSDYTLLTEGLNMDTDMALGKPLEDSDFTEWEFKDFIMKKYPGQKEHIRTLDFDKMKEDFNQAWKEFPGSSTANPASTESTASTEAPAIQSTGNAVPKASETVTESPALIAKRVAVAEANPTSKNIDRFPTMSDEELNLYAAGRDFVYSGETTPINSEGLTEAEMEAIRLDQEGYSAEDSAKARAELLQGVPVYVPPTITPAQETALRSFLVASTPMAEMSNINKSSYEELVRLYGDKVKEYFSENQTLSKEW